MLEPFRTFARVFESRARRLWGGFFLICILVSVVADSIDGTQDSAPAVFFGAIGGGGGAVFLGVNLLRFLPDDRLARWLIVWMAILWILGGAAALVFGLASLWCPV